MIAKTYFGGIEIVVSSLFECMRSVSTEKESTDGENYGLGFRFSVVWIFFSPSKSLYCFLAGWEDKFT